MSDFEQHVDNDKPFKVFEKGFHFFVAVVDLHKEEQLFAIRAEAQALCDFQNEIFQKGYWCGWDTLKPYLEQALELAKVAYMAVPKNIIVVKKVKYVPPRPETLKKAYENLRKMFPEKAEIISVDGKKLT